MRLSEKLKLVGWPHGPGQLLHTILDEMLESGGCFCPYGQSGVGGNGSIVFEPASASRLHGPDCRFYRPTPPPPDPRCKSEFVDSGVRCHLGASHSHGHEAIHQLGALSWTDAGGLLCCSSCGERTALKNAAFAFLSHTPDCANLPRAESHPDELLDEDDPDPHAIR